MFPLIRGREEGKKQQSMIQDWTEDIGESWNMLLFRLWVIMVKTSDAKPK